MIHYSVVIKIYTRIIEKGTLICKKIESKIEQIIIRIIRHFNTI